MAKKIKPAHSVSKRKLFHQTILAIAAITILSGLTQIIAPHTALAMMGVGISSETIYLFIMMSLFIMLFGAALLHATLASKNEAVVSFWASLQKVFGAAGAITALLLGLASSSVLIVAIYDLLAGLFIFWHWLRIRD